MKIIFITFFLLITFILPQSIFAQQPQIPKSEFYKAKVIRIIKESEMLIAGRENLYQEIEIQILDGKEKGKNIIIENGGEIIITNDQKVSKDETIIITKDTGIQGKTNYRIYEKYRTDMLLIIVILFFVFIIVIAGLKGLGSFMGLLISLSIILFYIIPQILKGNDPISISIYGSIVILLITTYLAHGVSKQTTIALFSTFIALILTSLISAFSIDVAKLTGLNEETSILQFGMTNVINLKGLLLAGIIIGTLGALNDITTTQAAAVFELSKTDSKLSIKQLFNKGFLIGKEHIASLINTLVLAYAGSSLVIFIFFSLNPMHIPYWVIINNELLSGEVVRTIAGSIGLMLVVPISTIFAAIAAKKWKT